MLGRHGFLYLISKILPAFSSLILLAVLTRLLSPEQYGSYSLTILVAGFVNSVFLQWIVLGLGRYLQECSNEYEKRLLLSTSCVVFLIISAILIAIFFLIDYLGLISNFSIITYLVGFIVISQAWFDLNIKILNTELKPIRYGVILAIKSITSCLFGIILVHIGLGPEGVCMALIFSLLFSSSFEIRHWSNVLLRCFDKNYFKKMWVYGSPLILIYAFNFIVSSSDRFFISYFMGNEALGVYSASYEFTQYSIGNILIVVHLAAFPLLVKAMLTNRESDISEQLKRTFLFLFIVITPLTFGVISISETLAEAFIGESFNKNSAEIIAVVSIAMFFGGMKSYYFDYAFQLSKTTYLQAMTVIISAIVNLVLNYFFIPIYGLFGAAFATVLSCFIGLIFSIILGRRVFPMPLPPGSDVIKIFFISFLMAFVIYHININDKYSELLVKLITAFFIYFIFLIIFNVSNLRNIIFDKYSHVIKKKIF